MKRPESKIDLKAKKTFNEPVEKMVGPIPVPEAVYKMAKAIAGRVLCLQEVVDSINSLGCGKLEIKNNHILLYFKIPASRIVKQMKVDIQRDRGDLGLRAERDSFGNIRQRKLDTVDIAMDIKGYEKMGDAPVEVWARVISFNNPGLIN